MDLRFSHTLPSMTTSGDAHMLCVLLHPDTCRSDCCPLSDPRRQQSWQPAILVRSAVIALSRQPSLLATFALLETHALVFWHCLHLCGPRTPSPFKFTQQSTSLLSCPVGKNIRRVILFEWVILFKKPTVMELIGNYIHRVNVIKGSLYSWYKFKNTL